MFSGCPGAGNIKGAPTLKIKICPSCGAEIEIFSTDIQVECACGFIAYNQIQSCILWCKYARECVGDELYERLISGREAQAAREAQETQAEQEQR